MMLYQAREIARKQNLDLVEVASTAKPPVCRLMDYGKFKYEQTRKEREARKSQKQSALREVRLRPKIGEHDYVSKEKSVRKFLEEGDKVKLTIMFRGRENAHPELGIKLLDRVADTVKDIALIEKSPTREGARLHIIISPIAQKITKLKEETRQKQDAEDQDAQGSPGPV
jgi:translation initiation factor IF-3